MIKLIIISILSFIVTKFFLISHNISFLYGFIGSFIGLFILSLFFTTEEENTPTKTDFSEPTITDLNYDTLVNAGDKGNSTYLKAKTEAIKVLHKFNIKKIYKKDKEGNDVVINFFPEDAANIPDEDIIYQYSRLADIRTKFNSDWANPEGNATESQQQSKIDGYIFMLAYCPSYAKQIIPHDEFINIWKTERLKKIAMTEFIQTHDIEIIWDKLREKFSDYELEINTGTEYNHYVDFEEFFKVFYDVYASYLEEKFGVTVTNPFVLLTDLATYIGYLNEFHMFSDAEMLQLKGKTKVLLPIKNKKQ
jgi:hypothetical protein